MTRTKEEVKEQPMTTDVFRSVEKRMDELENALRKNANDKKVAGELVAQLSRDMNVLREDLLKLRTQVQGYFDANSGATGTNLNVRKY